MTRPLRVQQRAAGVARAHLGVERVDLAGDPRPAVDVVARSPSGPDGPGPAPRRTVRSRGSPRPRPACAPPDVGPELERRRAQTGYGEDGQVALGVEDHDLSGVGAGRRRRGGPAGCRSPATTWALVTTRPGATTQPLPSCERLHERATPVILTIEAAAARTPRRCRHRRRRRVDRQDPLGPEGLEDLREAALVEQPAKAGEELARSAAGRRRPGRRRRAERPIARETGPSTPRTAPATNQVSRQIATRLATAPRRGVDGLGRGEVHLAAQPGTQRAGQRLSDRGARRAHHRPAPGCCAIVVASPSQSPSSCGSSHIASAPPPRKPTNDSALTSSPWR